VFAQVLMYVLAASVDEFFQISRSRVLFSSIEVFEGITEYLPRAINEEFLVILTRLEKSA